MEKLVYVVEFPILNGIPDMPDLLAKKTKPNAKMRQDTNPIAIFAVKEKRGKENEVKVVAIQIDNKPSKIQLLIFLKRKFSELNLE